MIDMIKLQGKYNNGKTEVFYNGLKLSLEESLKISKLSPTGFSWGYLGSGPSQLALAVCVEHYGKAKGGVVLIYKKFMAEVIANLNHQEDFDILLNSDLMIC